MEHSEKTVSEEQHPEDAAPQQALDEVMTEGQEEHHGSVGAIIGIVIIVLIIAFGGLYFWGSQLSEEAMIDDTAAPTPAEILSQPDPQVEELNQVSSSDNVADIEEDLLGTELEALDAELGSIEAELNASLETEAL